MNDNLKISIIIPVYNVADYIEDCLQSVASQTYSGEIECIIIDDCTPDNSCEIIERFIADYKGNIVFKLLHHEKNKGLSGARNTGMRNATGDYIYFLDSDDYITSDCLEKLAEPLQQREYDFVIGDFKTSPYNSYYDNWNKIKANTCYTRDEIFKSYTKGQWYMMAWNKLCNTKFLIDNDLYFKERIIHEDDLWSMQLAYKATSMIYINSDTYIYKLRSNSIISDTKSDLLKHSLAKTEVITNMISFATRQNGNTDKLYNYIIKFLNGQLYGVLCRGTQSESRLIYDKLKVQSERLLKSHNMPKKLFKSKIVLILLFSLPYGFIVNTCRLKNKIVSKFAN